MNLRTIIVVPTYDNAGTIGRVAAELLAATSLPLLIVDDGSRVPVRTVLAAAPLNPRVTILRHEHNRGKGAALQTALTWALANGFTHVLTFDGDGQHVATDVGLLLAAAAAAPWSLVIGRRVFPDANVPGASRFGRAISNFWIRYETGVAVQDSQSGMRLYPLFYTQNLRWRTRRYDFEVESLTRLLWAGAGLVEVPVGVVYPAAADRVSHFRKGWDNARITVLNIRLVALSLFRRHLGSGKLALATGAAAVVSGLYRGSGGGAAATALAVLLAAAVVLQLNIWVLLAWFAAAVALPPSLRPGLAGAGAGVALALAAVDLWRRRTRRRSGPKAAWSGRMRGGRFGNGFLWLVSRTLGLGATYACLAFIGPYFYVGAPRARRASLEYFASIFPGDSWLRRHWRVFVHNYTFGMVLLDRQFQSLHRRPVFDLRTAGRALFYQAAAGGRGVIVLSAHAGGWSLSLRALAANRLGREGVAAEFVAPTSGGGEAGLRAVESAFVGRTSLHNEAAPILAYRDLLQAGKIVGMMGDRPMSEKLALVPFLGKLAALDVTPFRLALALGVEVLYCFAFKTGYKTYDMTLLPGPVLDGAPGQDKDEVCEAALRHFAATLEGQLRRHPYQWFNFYPFFSTRPSPPTQAN